MKQETINSYQIMLRSEADTQQLGAALAQVLADGGVLHLVGDLGAGKTTLCRSIIQRLGHSGSVKSPTYTLVEPYDLGALQVYHFDLYRLSDPEELEFIGIRDYSAETAICLVEWPAKGGDFVPAADLILSLQLEGANRQVLIQYGSGRGKNMLGRLTKI